MSAGDLTPGTRVDDDPAKWAADQYPFPVLRPGEYGKRRDGVWMACLPKEPHDGFTYTGDFSRHDVKEHPDGTITVSPSILVTDYAGSWHGYLEKGVWREVP